MSAKRPDFVPMVTLRPARFCSDGAADVGGIRVELEQGWPWSIDWGGLVIPMGFGRAMACWFVCGL
jgi:hypothetical protein